MAKSKHGCAARQRSGKNAAANAAVMISAIFLSFCGAQSDHASTGTISGTVEYDRPAPPGAFLSIALYDTFPPSGPPIATKLLERYTLPFRYEFTGLAAGRYHVGACLDVDRMDTPHAGMLNAKRDPHGYANGGEPISIDDSAGAAGVDVQLRDLQ